MYLLGYATGINTLHAIGSVIGQVWDNTYLFFAFAAGLPVAFYLIRAALSLIKSQQERGFHWAVWRGAAEGDEAARRYASDFPEEF